MARFWPAILLVALVSQAGLLAWWLARLVQRTDAPLLPWSEALAPLAAAVVASAAVFVVPSRSRQVAAASIVIAACALVGPGAVATVALMLLSAHVIGCGALRFASGAAPRAATAELPAASTCILVGATLWIALIGATLALAIHITPVYVGFLAGSLVIAPSRTRESLAGLGRWLAAADAPTTTEKLWIGVAIGIAFLHLLVAARPEVGYDASTMHLQFAELVEHDRRWRFDVGRYAWAVMPMGADDAYLCAYLLDGERAARLLNVAFGALLAAGVFDVIRRRADREIALASVCLLASTPLWLLESGTLFVELAWTALLVAGLAAALDYAERSERASLAAAALCLVGSMQCKVIGAPWVAALACALVVCAVRARRAAMATPERAAAAMTMQTRVAPERARTGRIGGRVGWLAALALAIAAWPYVNAWVRTGNPVFPFMNHVFRSPLFDAEKPFNNPLYNAPLAWSTPWDIVLSSGRYVEGSDGAAGAHWLLLYPLLAIGLIARPTRARLLIAALAVGFAVIVYVEQSYLRYLVPAFALVAIVGGWILGDWVRGTGARIAMLAAGGALVAVNVALFPASTWYNGTLCLSCGFDRADRDAYIARYAPLRVVSAYLNAQLPDARVGFLTFNAPAPSGYVGYSRAANWHDPQAFAALRSAATANDVAAFAARFRLTHAVFTERLEKPLDAPLLAFRDRWTTPIARIGPYVVAAIRTAPQ